MTTTRVEHPKHYGGDQPYETIKVLFAWGLGRQFCIGNVIKYLTRLDRKDGEDPITCIDKAIQYLQFLREDYLKEREQVQREAERLLQMSQGR